MEISQMTEIKNRFTGAVIFKSDTAETNREAVVEAIKADADLADANLADANLAGADLTRANLARADLAGADLADAYLAGANLADADLARANLADADLADADLTRANLADANLADANLAGADLTRADLADADLTRANLADANLADANLAGANLAGANLAGANLADAYLAQARGLPIGRFTPDPVEPYVYRGVSSAEGRAARAKRYREAHPEVPVVEKLDTRILDVITNGGGTLEMGAWHTCETTHCRAGWAIHLAGERGYALEKELGDSAMAGRAIYLASAGRSPYFYGDNAAALADIRRCAEEEAQAATVAQ
jgi:hypothetical protein